MSTPSAAKWHRRRCRVCDKVTENRIAFFHKSEKERERQTKRERGDAKQVEISIYLEEDTDIPMMS